VTYARKIDKAEAAIDWRQDAAAIERRVRAFDPFPGASLQHGGETVKLWRAQVTPHAGAPGQVVALEPAGPVVACGSQALQLLELQRPGGSRVSGREFQAALRWRMGEGLSPS
jgi:methionyl-tRNA formyltransferase